jgi:hypothetical protein
MNHPAMMILAALVAVLVVSVSAFPGRTQPKIMPVAWQVSEPQPVQNSNVHAMVGASFHAVHASF